MKLVELHVDQLGARVSSEGDTVAGSYGRIGGVRVDLACSTRSDEYRTGGHALESALPIVAACAGNRQIGAGDSASFGHQFCDHGPLGKADALLLARMGDERTADLGSGGIATRVQDARE
jgi:hypothetical protein